MKNILLEHFDKVKIDILDYLSTNSNHFTDKRVLKAIKLFIIDDSDESHRNRQRKALRQQIIESDERYDLKWLSVLLIDLISEDFENVAYTLKKIHYNKLPNEIVYKLDLLKRVERLVYLYHDDKILDALEHLMQHPSSDSISTAEILWVQYHYYDSEEVDYDLLIAMANVIINHLSTYTTHFFLGYIFVEKEEFQKALESYSKALEICQSDPTLYEQSSWLYMRISDCLFNLKRHQEVIENTDQALRFYKEYNIGSENDISFYHFIFKIRCKSFYIMKDYKNALHDANSALEYCELENMEAMLGLKETIEKKCRA